MSDAAARAGALLTIDLDAIVANWRLLAARLRPGVRAAAVVKADAYGVGAARVAPALYEGGCRRFFVATLDEGIGLRAAMPEGEIIVFGGPLADTEEDYPAHGLIPVLNTPGQVALWAGLARRMGRRLPAVVHFDTGLSRLGLARDELAALAEDRDALAALDLLLVMSHLACADEPAHDLNPLQRRRFEAGRALFSGVPGSLAASSGIFLGAEWHADWVRPGAALYGVNPQPGAPNPMAQVLQLQGRILQVREIDAGESVGYGATHRARARMRLAVVAAGYADGLPRSLSNRGCAMLGGTRLPLVGRVSMDLMVFDVTGLPEGAARPGVFIDLIGPGVTLDDVAGAAGTIGYEILTALGRRYHRTYRGGTSHGGPGG